MEYFKIIILFLFSLVVLTFLPQTEEIHLNYHISAKPAQVANAIASNHFPKTKIQIGTNRELLWENEKVQIEIIEWEVPFKLSIDRKNSSRFSKYSQFYTIQENSDGSSEVSAILKWKTQNDFFLRWMNLVFFPNEFKRDLEKERDLLQIEFG
jgi:hypothetical protein